MITHITKKQLRQLTTAVTAVVGLFAASQLHAADITWADSTGNTTWTTDSTANSAPASSSWVDGIAPANSSTIDNAIFTSVANAQPNLTVQTRIASVDFRMADGGLSMTGNNNLFQLGTGGINSTLQTSGTNTITNTRIFLNNSSTWNLFSDTNTASTSTFTFDSTVNLNGQTLTVSGQRNSAANNVGVINFSQAITGSTSTNAGALTINSSNTNNTVNLNGVNTYVGVTTVNGGTVNVQNNQSTATGGWNIQTPNTAGVLATVNFATGSEIEVIGANKIQIGAASNSGSHPASTLNVAGTVTNAGALQMERNSNLNLNSGAIWDQAGDLTVTGRGGSSATLNVNAGAAMTYTGNATVKLNKSANSSGVGGLSIDSTGIFTTGRGFQATVNTDTTARGNGRVTLTNGGTLKLSSNVTDLSTEVHFELGAGGGVIDNSGFDATLSGVVTGLYGINRTGITGTGGLTSTGNGTLTLSGDNSFTGGLTLSGGTVAISASERIADANKLTLNGGNFNVGTFTETLGVLEVGASNGTITLGTGGLLVFGASAAETWTGTLTIAGTFISGSSLRFGTTESGLTGGQLSSISIAGFTDIGLNTDGFVTATVIPEPSTFAALAGLCGLVMASLRRRRRA